MPHPPLRHGGGRGPHSTHGHDHPGHDHPGHDHHEHELEPSRRKSHHEGVEYVHHHYHHYDSMVKEKQTGDLSGQWGKMVFCQRHYNSMAPIRILFQFCGRFPFSQQLEMDGSHTFQFMWYFPGAIYFVIALVIKIAVLLLGLVNVSLITLKLTLFIGDRNPILYERQRELEETLLRRYAIPLLFVYSSLIHGCISGVLLLSRNHYTAHYLTFWSRAVYTLHMDVARKALGFCVKVLIVFIIAVISICLLGVYRFGPTAIGLPTVFGDLTLRLFLKDPTWLQTKGKLRFGVQMFGAIYLIFSFTSSNTSILFFIYNCKLLKSAFAYWNGRAYASVLKGGEFAQTVEGRTTYKLLFKDYCVLLDLLEGLDQCSAWTVESYFGLQVFSLFFQLYFCIRTAKHGDNRVDAAYPEPEKGAFFIRPGDWAPGLVMLGIGAALMFSAAKSAADVAEEAMAGMEVLRRRTMLGRKTDGELYFMLSMFCSYTAFKKLELTAGGYMYMNKDFLIGLVSSVLSYFIILYQFQPVMDINLPATAQTRPDRIRIGHFLMEIEGLAPDHYETTQGSVDPWAQLAFQ